MKYELVMFELHMKIRQIITTLFTTFFLKLLMSAARGIARGTLSQPAPNVTLPQATQAMLPRNFQYTFPSPLLLKSSSPCIARGLVDIA